MLTKLDITNFQSHAQTSLSFVPGINIIHGHSDSGKSAVLRSLYWLMYNRPLGNGIMRHGTKETKVAATFTGEVQVERIKQSSFNGYILNGERLGATGSEVPEPVLSAIHVDVVNVQRQMDPPFLLSSSAAEVARTLNRLVDLDVIDKAYTAANHAAKEQERELASASQQEQELEEQLAVYVDLEDIEELLAVAGTMERDRDRLASSIDKVSLLVDQLAELTEEVEEVRDIADAAASAYSLVEEGVAELQTLEDARNAVKNRLQGLNALMGSLKEDERRITQLNAAIGQQQEWLKKNMPATCPLCDTVLKRSK